MRTNQQIGYKKMKNTQIVIIIVIAFLVGIMIGNMPGNNSKTPLQEGIIYSVSWSEPDGSIHGLIRSDIASAVPGGNGSWNMDLYGRLYENHIAVTNLKQKSLGPRIIPLRILQSVQFGDGGIKEVRGN
jgi:hypothetical protein